MNTSTLWGKFSGLDNNVDIDIDMDVGEFFKSFETSHKVKCFRSIDVQLIDGKKIPDGEKNNLSQRQIRENRGNLRGNTWSLSVKHVPHLYVIDFDTKELDGCKLKELLDKDKVANVETRKGFHYYIYLPDIPAFTQQQKIYKDEAYEIDVIKTNNIWETKDRTIKNPDHVKEYKWSEFSHLFDEVKMGISPPVSPTSSIIDETENNDDVDDDLPDDWGIVEIPLPKCNEEDFRNHLDKIKPRYSYGDWVKVGMMCYNNFDGSDTGFEIWREWTLKDASFKEEHIHRSLKMMMDKYETFNGDGNMKISYKQLIRWNAIDYPPKNKYQGWYGEGYDVFMKRMNEECMYYTLTGDILYYSKKTYVRNKVTVASQYYKKYSFDVTMKDGKPKDTNPFAMWLDSIDRKDVDKIVFNPTGKCASNQFNLWKGFRLKQTGDADVSKIQHWLDHIKNILADGDEPSFRYILGWFARILQTPWKKNKVCLVLHSVEGVGKSIILDMIGDIIGDDYYYTTSNLKHILGDFNGDAESKLLVNLNETNWGGDKKMVGAFKEFITDDRIVINKKGIQSYTISNYANTIITTNEDWIVNINGQDRRFNLRECSSTKHPQEYYDKVMNTDIQEIANYLYGLDISDYNPKVFIKSELHDLQIEKNMNSVEVFWMNVLEEEIDTAIHFGGCCSKQDVYDQYIEETQGDHNSKMNNVHFWRHMRKMCPSMSFKKGSYSSGPKCCCPIRDIAEAQFDTYRGKTSQ